VTLIYIFFERSDLNLYVVVLTHNLHGFKILKLKYRTFTNEFLGYWNVFLLFYY